MSRIRLLSAVLAAVPLGIVVQSATAQYPGAAPGYVPPTGMSYSTHNTLGFGGHHSLIHRKAAQLTPVPHPFPHAALGAPGYPVLDAPMNPVPVPNVPTQVGATMITNQALYPHEMLYPHRYRALYPPFYYTMTGRWRVTPWGVRSHEHWQLRGTEVKVKYNSSISPFALFHPPSIR